MPFDLPDELYQPLCASVGDLVINWALAESTIDMCVAIVFHKGGGKSLGATLPKAIDRKTEFLKNCFRTLPALSSWADEAVPLAVEANNLAYIRHTVVHGSLSEYKPADQSLVFDMPHAKPTMHHKERRALGIRTILATGGKCQALCSQFVDIDSRLAEALAAQDIIQEGTGYQPS